MAYLWAVEGRERNMGGEFILTEEKKEGTCGEVIKWAEVDFRPHSRILRRTRTRNAAMSGHMGRGSWERAEDAS